MTEEPLSLRDRWMKLIRPLAVANEFLLMTLFFFLVLTPYSLLLRLFRKDLLDEAWSEGESYWKPKEPVKDKSDYERPF